MIGVCASNLADTATLKKENEEYKRQLKKTRDLLQRHGLSLETAASTSRVLAPKLESHDEDDVEEQARAQDAYPSLKSRRVSYSLRNGKEPCFGKDVAAGARSGRETESDVEEEEELHAHGTTEGCKES